MKSGEVLLGVLAGAAVGAAIGILFAPEKGSVTRKKITTRGEDYLENLESKFQEIVDGVNKQIDKLKEEAMRSTESKSA
jgi:gas vesicle protein